MATKRTLCARMPGAMKFRYGMLPVCIMPLRANTWPKMSSHSAGWSARVMSSVKSWRSLRSSNSAMTNVLSMKLVSGSMKVLVMMSWLTKPLFRRSFGRYLAEVAAGIESGAGVMQKDLIQRVAANAQGGLKFLQGAQCGQLAHVHNRYAIAMALGIFQVMGGQKQSGAVVITQIDQVFPDSVPCNRIKPDGRLIEEEYVRPVQRSLGNLQPADHAPGIMAYQATSVGCQVHKCQLLPDAGLLLAAGNVIELGEDEQVLVAGKRSVHRNCLRYIADGATNLDRLGGDRKAAHACLARRWRQERGEHLDRGTLARSVGAKQAEDLTGIGHQCQRVDRRKRTEAARELFDFYDWSRHGWIVNGTTVCMRVTIAHVIRRLTLDTGRTYPRTCRLVCGLLRVRHVSRLFPRLLLTV